MNFSAGSHLERAITHLKNGSVRETISSLNEFNAKNKSTFKFQESEFQRKAFCKLALSKLSEDHDTSQDVTVDDWNTLSSSLLTTLRLLTRENVGTEELASECGLRSVLVKAELSKRPPEAIGCDRPGPEVEVIVESLKCLCNLVLNNRSLSRLCCELGVLQGLIERLEGQSYVLSKDICVFDIKLLFLLTSLHPEARREVRQLHDGLRVLTVLVERTIIAHVKATPDGPNKERKLVQLSSELDNAELSVLSDVFKILFAITMSWHDNEEDFTQAEREICVKLSHLLRILISYLHQGRDATRENTLQCLYDAAMNLPTFCADSFILDGVPEPAAKALLSTTFDGFDMSVVHFTVDFMDCKLQRKEVKTSMSVIGTLRNWSKGHRSIRRYLRSQILPPIGRVTQRPDEGDSVKSRLVQNMAASLFGVEDLISEFLFTLCKEKPPRFIKHVGYGHAAGLLMSRGLLGGGDPPNPSSYSDDSDSDTEEYKQCKESIDPITGGPRKKVSSSFDKLSEHEKEEEIEKLEKALEKLNKGGVFEMVGLDREGHARVIEQTQDKPAARRGSSASSDED